jgi:predicted nucleotide-binding protein
MRSSSLLDKQIIKFEKDGFSIVGNEKQLKFGLRKRLKKKRVIGKTEDIYIYYVNGEATIESLNEFFYDFEKFYKNNNFADWDQGIFICSGKIDEQLFDDLRTNIKRADIRKSISMVAEKSAKSKGTEPLKTKIEENNESKNIFIVHGRDHSPVRDLENFLFKLGLKPIVLSEQASGGRTIVEQLEKYSNVGYAFVILTPDDMACPKSELEKSPSNDQLKNEKTFVKLNPRSRQNTILEFGYFMGSLGRNKVCCLYKSEIELPTDMLGIIYVKFDKSIEEIHYRIINELKEAGYNIG